MLLSCGVGEDSWEFFGLQGDLTSPSERKSILNIYWKNWCWSWNSSTLATSCEVLTHLKRPWCWERLKAEEKGMTESEMVEWHHQLNGHEFKQAPGVGDGQGSLARCSPWGCKESDTTEQLNWAEPWKPKVAITPSSMRKFIGMQAAPVSIGRKGRNLFLSERYKLFTFPWGHKESFGHDWETNTHTQYYSLS